MKQPLSCQIRRWTLFVALLLFTAMTVGYLSTQRAASSSPTPRKAAPEPVLSCPIGDRALKLTMLGSRPFCMHLLPNDIVSNSIAGSHSWMPHQTKLISLMLANAPSKPAVFLDIGANIGWFTLVMSVLGHRVIAIEPMDNNVKLLQASLRASQASQKVTVYRNGLSVQSQTCVLYSDNGNIGDGHTVCGISSEKEAAALIPSGYSIRQMINSTRLDALVSQDIDVMKIDVEGSELYAVQGGIRLFEQHRVRHIISEFNPHMMRGKKSDPYEYLKFFVARGYSIRIVNDPLVGLYERNAWQTVRVYQSEQDLRQLCNGHDYELWFTKD